MSNIKQTVLAASEAIPVEFMKQIGASNVQVVSDRSLRFDITPTAAGVNRIKITLQPDGEWRLRTYKVEEMEDVPGILPASLTAAIAQIAGIGEDA
jgi:hypothetical protein